MPTPVGTARQCLTEEAARALDDAVAVARRRSHAQTTSLHAVSALLALPSSSLREACARARSAAYSPRLQLRALELCVGVSLDRCPSAKAIDEPPVSNSLMAAIKRSQTSQRRQPETFHLYQQLQQQNQSALSCVKVELKHFILSILDDPVVSRVFGDAGFRSYDVKLEIVNPPPLSRFSRSRCPPLFLCNLPFAGCSGLENGDEHCRRIGEVLVKEKGKNPLLIGACAKDALGSFTECVESGKGGQLPAEIEGLGLFCIAKEICDFATKGASQEMMALKFREVGKMVERSLGPGIVVNYGELEVFDGYESADSIGYVVSQLSSLLEVHNGKLWLVGAAGSYETYMKFLARFPSLEKDWDLHLLPITSSSAPIGGLHSKPGLMGSFVPLGGFFSTPSEFKNLFSSKNQSIPRCELCNERYEQEASVILKGGSTISVADQYSACLSSWLQVSRCDTNKRVDTVQAKDDRIVLNRKLEELQRKWNDICQQLHGTKPFQPNISQARSQVPGFRSFQLVTDGKESSSNELSLNESEYENLSSFMTTDLQKTSLQKPYVPVSGASEAENANYQPKLLAEVSKNQRLERERTWPPYPLCSLSLALDHTSSFITSVPSSDLQKISRPDQNLPVPVTSDADNTNYKPKLPAEVSKSQQALCSLSLAPDGNSSSSITSVTTDLGLGTLYAHTSAEHRKPEFQDPKNHLQSFSGSVTIDLDGVSENASNYITQSSSCSGTELGGQLNPKDFKALRRVLAGKVGWQDEVICTVSQTISCCRNGHGRCHGSNRKGDIWLGFLGPDKVGKKKFAIALAEVIFDSRESVVYVDLSSVDGSSHSNSIFDRQNLNSYNVKFRGKTVVDYIAEELSKKPQSVVLLENVDKADFLAQNSLSQAIRTGKFPDSHGREIGINNTIFVATSRIANSKKDMLSERQHVKFSEERVLDAKGWEMQILVGCVTKNVSNINSKNVMVMPRKEASNPGKRKLFDTSGSTKQDENWWERAKRAHKASKTCLNLNLPVEEMEENDFVNSDTDSAASENSEAWLEDFFDQLDGKAIFKPFDFDALAEEILKQISLSFQKIVGSEALLEIDSEVMVQMLAAAWLSDRKNAVQAWIDQTLRTSFIEAWQRYNLSGQSVVKLVACEGVLMEEEAPGVCLPARIILN